MGPTGTGKTSFINMLSGSNLRIGRELESCTSDVEVAKPFDLDGRMISLIDTPGFDDTTLSAASVLNMIAAYLSYSYVLSNTRHFFLDDRLIQRGTSDMTRETA